MGNSWYYDYVNLDSTINKMMLSMSKSPLKFRYLKNYVNTYISMLGYKNLPQDLTTDIVQQALFFNTRLCFYNIEAIGGVTLLRWIPNGDFNRYMRPQYVNLETLNGKGVANNVPFNDIVLVRDNEMDIPPFLYVMEYIECLDKIESSMFKVLNVASLPIVVAGSKKQANSLRELAKKLVGQDPFVVGDDAIGDQLKSYNIDLPVNPIDIYTIKSKYMNELQSALGIYAVDDKRERMITGEVANINNYTDYIYQGMINEHKRWIDETNKRFGTDIIMEESYKEIIKKQAEQAKEMSEAEQVKTEVPNNEPRNDNSDEK